MNEEIKIITLGDIFKNLETEEKAFKLKDYIISLQKELDQYKNNWEELKKYINEEWTVSMFSGDNYLDGYSNGINEMKKDILNKMKELEEDK